MDALRSLVMDGRVQVGDNVSEPERDCVNDDATEGETPVALKEEDTAIDELPVTEFVASLVALFVPCEMVTSEERVGDFVIEFGCAVTE